MYEIKSLLILVVLSVVLSAFVTAVDVACFEYVSGYQDSYTGRVALTGCSQGSVTDSRLTKEGYTSKGETFCIYTTNYGQSFCQAGVPTGYVCRNNGGDSRSLYIFYPPAPSSTYSAVGSPCLNRPCYADEDCNFLQTGGGKEYCIDGTCQVQKCTDECPGGSICTSENLMCSHIDDVDGDGLPGTLRLTGTKYLSSDTPTLYDCYDYSTICSVSQADPSCKNSDYGDSGRSKDAFIDDCWDFCIDKDGDSYCDYSDIKKTSTPSVRKEWKDLPQLDMYRQQLIEWLRSMQDDNKFESVPAVLGITSDDEGEWEMSDLSDAMPFDCNDNDPLVNPGIKEEEMDNPCNFYDDDCDGKVDECSNNVDKLTRTLVNKELKCVYREEFKGCQVWDSDGDGYKNASFGCPECTDCNDQNSAIHPGATDDSVETPAVDENCNGVDGEMLKSDIDTLPDIYDKCDYEGTEDSSIYYPVDYDGCWYSTWNGNLVGWS